MRWSCTYPQLASLVLLSLSLPRFVSVYRQRTVMAASELRAKLIPRTEDGLQTAAIALREGKLVAVSSPPSQSSHSSSLLFL